MRLCIGYFVDLQAVGVPLVTVRATDRDGDEVRYRIVGDGNAQSYFTVNEETGEISVKQDLRLDTRQTYTVCRSEIFVLRFVANR